MGKKGKKSQRGVGEKDEQVRDRRIYVWVTAKDIDRLEASAKKLGIPKSELIIGILRLLFVFTED